MKVAFTEGRMVRFKIPGGALARIVRYIQEGWYLIRTVPDQRELIANEDDLEVVQSEKLDEAQRKILELKEEVGRLIGEMRRPS